MKEHSEAENIPRKARNSIVHKLHRKLDFRRNVRLRPCEHCKLIDSGDVALYQVTCPQCGEIPPSRKHRYPNLSSGYVSVTFRLYVNI